MPTAIINRWDRGITNDPRDTREGVARVVSNFDILTDPRRMIPYRQSESGDNAGNTKKIQNFEVGFWQVDSSFKLFALGVQSGANDAKIFFKDLDTAGAPDLSDDTWTTPAVGEQGVGTATSFNLFKYYAETGLIYGARDGSHIWAFTPDGSTAFDDTHQALSYSFIGQGIVHSEFKNLYIPYDNTIAVNDNGSWTVAGLTGPSDRVFTTLADYRGYVAIASSPKAGFGRSFIHFWDGTTDLEDVDLTADAEDGAIIIMENAGGELISISQVGGQATIDGYSVSSLTFRDRVVFRRFNGVGMETIFEIVGGRSTTKMELASQVVDGRIYFMMSIELNGVKREGVWSIGRSKITGEFTLVHERTPNNDTALVSSDDIHSFIKVGDYLFQSYSSAGNIALSKTDDQANFISATAVWESAVNPSMPAQDWSKKKQLTGVRLKHSPLNSSDSIALYYRVDGGDWQEIYTNTTDDSFVFEKDKDANKNNFAVDVRDIEFRIESKGATVEEFMYNYKQISSHV